MGSPQGATPDATTERACPSITSRADRLQRSADECREVIVAVEGPPCGGIALGSVAVSAESAALPAEWRALTAALASSEAEQGLAGVQWLFQLLLAAAELRLQPKEGASQALLHLCQQASEGVPSLCRAHEHQRC